ncbi:hypothetical protein BCR35DRAFT_352679 [Leucosporidium creatinivorum]|uniref:Uncharacterized protein n=1 Tax=Leucosporidium creatinivorum TaxID=106004 RepID=A0A1Y2F791_9BASI|nr:hypothetical protein BCR35DRAFT_352679 [Leucosporidium creatinivorum]
MFQWFLQALFDLDTTRREGPIPPAPPKDLTPCGPCYIAELPFELLLPILDLGAEGYSTRDRQRKLNSFSLICRAWREVAQTLLWHSPTFVSSTAARRFLEIEPEGGYVTRSLTVYAPRSGDVRRRVTVDLVEKLVERCRPRELDLDELPGPVLSSPGLADLKILRFEETRYSHPYPKSVPFSLDRLSITAYSNRNRNAYLSDCRQQLFSLLTTSSLDTLTHLDLQDVEDPEIFAFCIPFASFTHLTHLILPTYPVKRFSRYEEELLDDLVGSFLAKATRLAHLSLGDLTPTTFKHVRSALPSTLEVVTVRQYAGLQLSLLVEALRDGNVELKELRLPRGSLEGGKERGFVGMGEEYWCVCY